MNAISVIEAAPAPVPTLEQWLEIGRAIADEGRRVGWAFADWARQGEELGYTEQIGMDFLGQKLGIAPARLKIAFKAAEIPPQRRDMTLTIEHHAQVADLPAGDQLDLLNRARKEHWTDADLRKQVISRKVEIGGYEIMTQDEWDYHSLMSLQHAWNRASVTAREDFIELVEQANGGLIDA